MLNLPNGFLYRNVIRYRSCAGRGKIGTERKDLQMAQSELSTKYALWIQQYRDMFGYVPKPDDFICLSEEHFYLTLVKAVKAGKDLKCYLICKKNYRSA